MKNVFFVFVFFCFFIPARAQNPFLASVSIEQGLSQGFVPSICQDEDGFLWFATKNGLNRYDGYHFKVFKNDPFDSLSLNNNEVVQVAATGDFIIVFTRHIDLMLFHRKTLRFYSIRNSMMSNREILLGFALCGKNSLLSYTYLDGQFITYHIKWSDNLSGTLMSEPRPKNCQNLFSVHLLYKTSDWLGSGVSPDGNLYWLFSEKSLIVHEINSGRERRIPPPPFSIDATGPIARCAIFPELSGVTWLYCQNQVARWDGHHWELFRLSGVSEGVLQVDHTTGLLWACKDKQVSAYNLATKPFRPEPVWNLDIGRSVRSCFTDRTGLVWFGTDALGVVKFNPGTGAFKNYVQGLSVYCQPVFNGKKHVLLSDVRRGDSGKKLLNLRTGTIENLINARTGPLPEVNIPATENGNFWWTSWDRQRNHAVLVRYNPETGNSETIPVPENLNVAYAALKFVHPGQIWIITTQNIVKFNIQGRRFTVYAYNQDFPAEVYAIERSAGGTWWIGTMDGLIKAVPNGSGSFSFSKIVAGKGDRNSLRANCVKSLLADPSDPDLLWIGTNGMGMSRLNIKTGQISHFTEAGGILPDDVVYGILPEVIPGRKSPVCLWISTNKGLTRFNPANNFSQFFIQSDGLQDNEFNTYASFRSDSGLLLFGGVNGLTVFNPRELAGNFSPPTLKFTELTVNGMSIHAGDSTKILRTDISFQNELVLSNSNNNILIQFAAMDFTAPGRNQFAYYLDGAEKPWVHRGFEHSAQYLNLSPGTYTFNPFCSYTLITFLF